MDKGHQAASPVVGPSSNIPAKLKNSHTFTDSPNNNNCNACHSPSQSIIGSSSRNLSPFPSYNADSMPDDVVLPKNGTKCVLHTGASTSPFYESSPVQASIASPSTLPPTNARMHASSNSKRTYNKYGGSSSPSDAMTASRIGGRMDKSDALVNSDQMPHAMLSRSRSVNSNLGKGSPNNINSNIARRMCSVDSLNHTRDGANSGARTALNSTKFPEKGQLRQSPRAATSYEGRCRSDSPFSACPTTSFESTLPTNPVKPKLRTADSSGATSMRLNHLMSRTSSNNSISDLSPCSLDENSSNKLVSSKSSALTIDSQHSSATYTSTCNSTTNEVINDLNIDNTLLSTLDDAINIDSLRNDNIRLDAFEFPSGGNDRDDIGSNALNLSAEEVQQTLSSVNADSALPDLSLACTNADNSASDLNEQVQSDVLNEDMDFDSSVDRVELREILSPTTSISMPITTSSTSALTTVVTSAVDSAHSNAITTSMDSLTGSFGDKNLTNSSSSADVSTSTSTSFSSAPVSGGPTKSHLQEILGAADTNRLKNMARPIDPSQYSSPTSTSFTPNFNNQSKGAPFLSQISSSSDRPSQPMSVTSPSGVSPRHKFPPGSQYHQRILHRTASNPHPMQSMGSHNYEINHSSFDHPSKYPEHSMPMGPRPGMPFDQSNLPLNHSIHEGGNMPYGLPSPQASSWQRNSAGAAMMGPHGIPGGLNEGNKSPRGFGTPYPSRPVNPMSGLQSTVDAIPNLSSMTKNNNNNMGPPHSNQRIPTPGAVDAYNSAPLSNEPRSMLPPPSPLTHDKRSVSADGSVTVPTMSKSKGNKRERGQSLDSKDGDKKEPGAKKRRKSKSKDESKKADLRGSGRLNETQGSYFCVFNTEMANAAAAVVVNQSMASIIYHHNRYQGNCRLLPSRTSSFATNQNNSVKMELISSHNLPSSLRSDVKLFPHSTPPLSMDPNQVVKSEPHNTDPTSLSTQVKAEQKPPNVLNRCKSEADPHPDINNIVRNPSPTNEGANKDRHKENLTDEERKHREEALFKLERIKSSFIKSPYTNSAGPWTGPHAPGHSNYSMSRYLQKVQETHKDSKSPEGDWLRLVQAYNEEKRRNRQIISNNPLEGIPSDPPPYSPAGPPHINQRWIATGHPTREPVPSPDLPNPRYPHNCIPGPVRIPHEGARFPVSYGPGRFPRGYVPGGPNSRMSIYPGPNIPPGSMMARTPISRLPQSHGIVPTNEAYPFSEKLKEQASMYRAEGMHSHTGPVGFDMNPGEPMAGPRMGSPDWPPYGNPPNQVPINRGLPHMPPEGLSPPGPGIGSAPMISNSMANQVMDPGLPPSVDPSIDPSMAMQMHNPALGPSFASKGSCSLPTYPVSSLPGMQTKSFPGRDMRSSSSNMVNPTLDGSHTSGMMGETMARRGEPRPPDLNINASMARSSPGFHGGRHAMPSPGMTSNPGMMSSQFIGGESVGYVQSGLPHLSPHPANIPRSPMLNSPSLMKSPMGGVHLNNQMQYGVMGQGGPMQSMEPQPGMISAGPRSAGPAGGTPADWNSMSQPSVMPSRIQQGGPVMPGNPNHKPAIQQMIDGINRFQLPNILYQNEVKDSVSPPSMQHFVDNPAMSQELSLVHDPSRMEAPVTPGSAPVMLRHPHPAYDSGPRSAGPRMMGPMMVETFGPEFNRPPSHPGMCMSPGPASQGVMQQLIEMHGPPAGFISQSNMMPPSDNPGSGSIPVHPGCNQQSNLHRLPEFDLSGILPSDKPSETLSYFPSAGGNTQDASQMGPVSSINMPMQSPPMPQQAISRYPNMAAIGQRPLTPGAPTYPGNNPAIRMPLHGNFIGPNPPGYPAPVGYMSPSWEGMPRPQMMQNNGPSMHPNYQRGLI